MEPLIALSLASNVIQVVDFSARLVFIGYKNYKSADGPLAEHVDAEAVINSLRMLTAKLRRSSQDDRGMSGELSSDDKSLIGLCEKCGDVADELLAKFSLDKVA